MIVIRNYINITDKMQYFRNQFMSLIYYPKICCTQIISWLANMFNRTILSSSTIIMAINAIDTASKFNTQKNIRKHLNSDS